MKKIYQNQDDTCGMNDYTEGSPNKGDHLG